jgi:hypothetical protein
MNAPTLNCRVQISRVQLDSPVQRKEKSCARVATAVHGGYSNTSGILELVGTSGLLAYSVVTSVSVGSQSFSV